jgi:hypothetical protein
MLAQQIFQVLVASCRCYVQRRFLLSFVALTSRFVFEQQFRNVLATILRRSMQRRATLNVIAGNQLRIGCQQRFDLCQITGFSRIMDWAKESDAIQGHSFSHPNYPVA